MFGPLGGRGVVARVAIAGVVAVSLVALVGPLGSLVRGAARAPTDAEVAQRSASSIAPSGRADVLTPTSTADTVAATTTTATTATTTTAAGSSAGGGGSASAPSTEQSSGVADGLPRSADVAGGSRAGDSTTSIASAATQAEALSFAGDRPDPFLLVDDDRVWVYSTNHDGMHVPVVEVRSDGTLVGEHDALPQLPSWSPANVLFTWSPAVLRIGDAYVLYYAALDGTTGVECISAATSTDAAGPFVDTSDRPLVCPADGQGAIDPSPVAVDGQVWLLWKQEATWITKNAIVVQQLTGDGLALVGSPKVLLTPDQPWEDGVVEAPSIVRYQGRWYLTYAGNDWATGDYQTGLAVCASVTGPCAKVGRVEFGSTPSALGPGGAELVVVEDGSLWVAYHSWAADGLTWAAGGRRELHLRKAELRDGALVVG